MISILILGFLLGLQHALEADHLAAVASLTSQKSDSRSAMRYGSLWGMGHTFTLFLLGGLVLLTNSQLSADLANSLEMAVACLLILLGANIILRLVRDRIHIHIHRHDDVTHLHAHSHVNAGPHEKDPHQHTHRPGLGVGPFFIGTLHGLAGTAALTILVMGTVDSIWQGLGYILLFGAGSILGMALLAVIISYPLRWTATYLTWAHNGMKGLVATITLGVGVYMLWHNEMAIQLWNTGRHLIS